MRRSILTAFLIVLFFFAPSCLPYAGLEEDTGTPHADRTVNLPFDTLVSAQCLYGPNSTDVLRESANRYDVDLRIAGDNTLVYAPVTGIAYVHNDDGASDFGLHVNIDLDDGTFVTVSHLESAFIANGEPVATGELIGEEGESGAGGGLRVGIGRDEGDPAQIADAARSIAALSLNAVGLDDDVIRHPVEAMHCDSRDGAFYESLLATPRWHPDGTLVKTPDADLIYLVDQDRARAFPDDAAVTALGYSLQAVTLVSPNEMSCYDAGVDLPTASASSAKIDDPVIGVGGFRDGTLIRERSSPTIYDMIDGVAEPIADAGTFALAGFSSHPILVVGDGDVAVERPVGNCGADIGCLKSSDLLICNGPTPTESGAPDEP